jgi:phage terminase large subunit (gpA)
MQARMAETVARVLRQACRKWAPPRKIKTRDWANKYRYLSSIEAARPGKYVLDVTPYLAWENSPLDALDDPSVQVVVCQKSAQVAWTSGVLGNFLGKSIDAEPSPILVLFPKEGAAKEYMDEKFVPMVEATPALREKVDTRIRA